MSDTIIKDMFKSAVHIGHRTQKWNPRMKKFIYGERNGIHILNLEKTAAKLEQALDFMAKVLSEGKNVLFVSTKPQSVQLVEETAQALNMPYVVSSWIPGLLTNFSSIKGRIKYMVDIKENEASGELEKYTKKERQKIKKEIAKLEASLGGVETLNSLPDAVFVLDTVRDAIVVNEAKKLKIPVIGIVDSNSDPEVIDYPIPANDDAVNSIKFILGQVKGISVKKAAKK